MARFTLRHKNKPGSLIAVVDDPDIQIDEICEVCEKQGAIWHVHPESEDHKGTPSFKPWTPTPEYLRKWADRLEQESR